METQIKKWGNSLGIRIPSAMATEIGLTDGTLVDLELDGQTIVIKPSNREDLDELLTQVTKDNVHGEQDFGTAQGNEAW